MEEINFNVARPDLKSELKSPLAWDKAMNIIITYVSGHLHSRMFSIVMKHSICDLLEQGPKTIKQVSDVIGMTEDATYRLLRYFVAHDLFVEDKSNLGTFGKTEVSSLFSKSGGSYSSIGLRYAGDLHYKMFETLPKTFETNQSTGPQAIGLNHFWEIFAIDQPYKELFNETMKVYTGAAISNIMENTHLIDFSKYETIVDIGGNHGLLLSSLLDTLPNVKGINFDLQIVLDDTKNLAQHERLTHVGGDFFKSVPESDCYIMKFILHDWDRDSSVSILKTIGQSMKKGAKIYIFDMIIDPSRGYSKYEVYIDILMFQLVNAKERTITQWHEIFQLAGFKLERIVDEIKTGCMIISKNE